MSDDWKFTADDFEISHAIDHRSLSAECANAKLAEWIAKAPVVLSEDSAAAWWKDGVHPDPELFTHTARLIHITPIVRDTAESLLREFADWDPLRPHTIKPTLEELHKRARRLVGK